MGNILVVLQQTSEGKLMKSALVAVSAARELQAAWKKGELVALALGAGAEKAADEAGEYGIGKCYFSEAQVFEKYLAAPYSEAVKGAVQASASDTVVAASTSTGKDLLPRVAAMIDASQASDILAVNSDGSLRRPMYAGNVIADVELNTPVRCITVRTTAFQAAAKSGGKAEKIALSSIPAENPAWGEVVGYELSKGGRPELGDAEIVVSGGRALQSAENFEKYIFPLADALGAAVGASRAAVDSGYAPNDWQVGQTGKVVAPGLYIAVGISGAIQHLAGMKDSKKIVAINKDPDAPIFEIADYGLVADLYQAVPEFTEAVKKAKNG